MDEVVDVNDGDPCCEECVAWRTGVDITAAHTECVDCGKCREVPDEEFCYVCKYRSCERGEDCADKEPAK